MMEVVIARLRAKPGLTVTNGEHAWVIRFRRPEDVAFDISVPHAALEWFVVARRVSTNRECWKDKADYQVEGGETGMERDVEAFVERSLTSTFRVSTRDQHFEWSSDAGSWEKVSLLPQQERSVSQLETPFTIRQVETHLVFGPIARYIPLGYVVLAGGVAFIIAQLWASRESPKQHLDSIGDTLPVLICAGVFSRESRRRQAIIGWMAAKFAIGFGAFLVATVGAGMSFVNGYSDAWANLFLGLIWIPGLEFVPRITPHQRYLTLARIVLSIPSIYFGVKSGNWHW